MNCLQADVTRCGGYTGWLRATAIAGPMGCRCRDIARPIFTLMQLCASQAFVTWSIFHDHSRVDETLFDGVLIPEDGSLVPRPWTFACAYLVRKASAASSRRHIPANRPLNQEMRPSPS